MKAYSLTRSLVDKLNRDFHNSRDGFDFEFDGTQYNYVTENLVSNGDFDSDLTGWQGDSNYVDTWTSPGYVNVDGQAAGNWFSQRFRYSTNIFESGKTYYITFMARSVSGKQELTVSHGSTTIKSIGANSLPLTWTAYDQIYNSSAAANTFSFFCNGFIAEFDLDDITVREVEEA